MTQSTTNKVSIRLESGGHNFSAATLPVATDGCVEVVLSTHKTALIPADIFEPADPEVALAAVGIAPAVNESVVYSDGVDGIVAVMAINTETLAALRGKYGDLLRFISPLQETSSVERGVAIHLCGDVLYVRVYDNGLLFAEAMEVRADADILYYLERIHRVYNIYNTYARATGEVERIEPLCKRRFRNLEIVK